MIIDYCVAGVPKEDISNIPDDSKDVEDLDDSDTQKLLTPKKTNTNRCYCSNTYCFINSTTSNNNNKNSFITRCRNSR